MKREKIKSMYLKETILVSLLIACLFMWNVLQVYASSISGNDVSRNNVSGNDISAIAAFEIDSSESDTLGIDDSGDDTSEPDASGNNVSGNDASEIDASGNGVSGNDASETDVSGNDASALSDTADLQQDIESTIVSLQVPSNIDFTLDPFGIAGKGQLYSDDFVICNIGEQAGVLHLSNIVCSLDEYSDIKIVTSPDEIYANSDKNVLFYFVYGEGEKFPLSQQGAELSIRLEPGQEFAFSFSGYVNERTTLSWSNSKLGVSLVYFWEGE